MTNYYKILGVKKDATQEEIKISYKNLMKKYHPDLYQGDKTYAEKKAKEINGAYEVLSNPESRKQYDLEMFPPTPISGYYSSSSDNYSYTPPRYDRPPNNYYDEYKNRNANPGREYNYNDFANYHADRRYTDYHRSKTPNSNYKDQKVNNDIPTKMMNIFDTLTKNKKFFAILLVIILYCVLFITTIGKFNDYMSGKSTGPLLNEDKPVEVTPYENKLTPEEFQNLPSQNTHTLLREDFDIYDYFTDNELRVLYRSGYQEEFNSFDEFVEYLEDQAYYELYVKVDY